MLNKKKVLRFTVQPRRNILQNNWQPTQQLPLPTTFCAVINRKIKKKNFHPSGSHSLTKQWHQSPWCRTNVSVKNLETKF